MAINKNVPIIEVSNHITFPKGCLQVDAVLTRSQLLFAKIGSQNVNKNR